MKTTIPLFSIILASFGVAFFWLPQLTHAQCPQICDSNANTALGDGALSQNNSGIGNTAVGSETMLGSVSGNENTVVGFQASLLNMGSNNTAVGSHALNNNTGSTNIAVGASAGINLTTGSENIDIGNFGDRNDSNTIRIGSVGTQRHTYIAGISGVTVANGVGVIIDGRGHLGTVVSSARFKEAIRPMDKASESILSLRPVTFRYKHDLDPQGIPQFGLVAEDVEKINPDLVARDEQGKPYSVRYEAVNAMLLNEFLKEHRKVEKLEATIAQQHKDFEAAVAELKGQIQKVSAQLELSKPATQTVLNNQ
jgi:trimeric autotransporter adhesin